jgi:hypothetical protein
MNITELDNTPAPESLNALFAKIKETHLPQELDTEQLLRLTLWIWNCNGNADNADDLWHQFLNENDNYCGEHDTTADFAEYWFTELAPQEISESVVVDWDATWNYSLQYDFHEYAIRYDLDGDGFAELHRYFWHSH